MKPNRNNPFSPDYRPPELPDPFIARREPGVVERVVTGLFVGVTVWVLSMGGFILGISLLYGLVLLVFRHAFGLELPNPYALLK